MGCAASDAYETRARGQRFLAVALAFGKAFKSEEAALAWLAEQPGFSEALDEEDEERVHTPWECSTANEGTQKHLEGVIFQVFFFGGSVFFCVCVVSPMLFPFLPPAWLL